MTGAIVVAGGSAAAPAASAAPTSTAPATVAAAPKVLRTSRVDIDGDLRRDTTTLTRTGSVRRGYTYTITTRTARGAKSAVSFRVEDNGADPANVWYGTAGLDGARGAEIVVNESPVGDGQPLTVFTWRRGRLVRENPPAGITTRDGHFWVLTNMPWLISGYTFTTDRNGRHVTHHRLTPARGKNAKGKVSGTHTRYTWSKTRKTWVKTSTRRTGLVSDPYAQRHYAGLFGVTLR